MAARLACSVLLLALGCTGQDAIEPEPAPVPASAPDPGAVPRRPAAAEPEVPPVSPAERDPLDIVSSIAWSPDGGRIAAGLLGGALVVWDLRTGTRRTLIEPHGSMTSFVQWSPDGLTIAHGDLNGGTDLVAAATGKGTRLRAPNESLEQPAFSPDGTRVATSGSLVGLWDRGTGALQRQLFRAREVGRLETASEIAWSHDGTLLAAYLGAWMARGPTRARVMLWDSRTGETRRQLRARQEGGLCLAFSPDDRTLAACEDAGEGHPSVALWDPRSGRRRAELHASSQYGIYDLAFSPDGARLAAATLETVVPVWEVSSRAMRRIEAAPMQVRAVAWSPNGRTLAMADQGIELRRLSDEARVLLRGPSVEPDQIARVLAPDP